MRNRIVPIVVGLALVVALAACGSDAGPPARVRTSAIPSGADEVVFRIDTRGGFTPVEYQLGTVPAVSVYGDGRVIVTGPVTEQYPPNALPNLLTGVLTRAELERLAGIAVDENLLRARDFGEPAIADAPTTTVTINIDGAHTQSAYALDFTEAETPGLSPAQAAARRALRRFTAAVGRAATDVATEAYTATEVAVYARAADAPGTTDDGSGVEPGRADWPLASDLATIGEPIGGPGADAAYRCAVLAGDDARTALDAAKSATSITRWGSGGAEFTIVWRPLLPDEHACP